MTLTTEQLEIRGLAHEFAARELRPHSARWDKARALDEEVFGQLGELGLLGMTVPQTYGGLGLDWLTYLLVLEELGRRGARRRRPQRAGRGVADPARDGRAEAGAAPAAGQWGAPRRVRARRAAGRERCRCPRHGCGPGR